jgi:putative tricarboxylic transport membrane protein
VLGLVLGTLMERALIQTSAMGDGSLLILLQRPLAITILLLAAAMLVAPTLINNFTRRRLLENDTEAGQAPDDTATRR